MRPPPTVLRFPATADCQLANPAHSTFPRLPRCRSLHAGWKAQYFGPTNASSRATASFFATEIVVGLEKRHSTPS